MLGKKQERNVDTSRAFLLLLLLLRSDEFCYKWLVFPRVLLPHYLSSFYHFFLSVFLVCPLFLLLLLSVPSARWRIVLNHLILHSFRSRSFVWSCLILLPPSRSARMMGLLELID